MAKFTYSFQKILELKEKEQESAQVQLAKAIQSQEQAEQRLHETYQKLYETQEQLEEKQHQGIHIMTIKMTEDYLNHLRMQLFVLESQVQLENKKVERQQEKLQAVIKEVKKWAKIKEKQLEQHLELQKAEEQLQLDALAISRSFYGPSMIRGGELE